MQMTKSLLATFALLTVGSAFGAPVPVTVTSGGAFVLTFNGSPTLQTNPPTVGDPVSYLSSVIYFSDFSFTGVTGDQTRVDFQMDAYNTSGAPLTGSILSVIGFNTTPTISGTQNSVTGAFDTIYRADTLPGVGTVEFCVSDVMNCAGVGGGGIAQGTGGTAYVSLFFNAANLSSLTFDDVFVRYQNLTGVNGVFNGVGSPVPEASAYVVLFAGFVLIGIVVRRRRPESEQSV